MKFGVSLIGVIMFVTTALAGPQKPFPQNERYAGVIRPSNRSETELNKAVQAFYDGWKKEYIVEAKSTPGGYYLATSGGTNAENNAVTVSEGHGYGMIVLALMAGYDTDAQKIFDGFVKVFKKYPSDINPALMTWQILGQVGSHEKPDLAASATDGDFDIAYAFILADRQWGSKGEINYLKEAKTVIAGLAKTNIHHRTKRVLLGDWVADDQKWAIGTRSSDWVPAHYKLFGEVSGNEAFWNEVNDTIYSIMDKVQDPTTGMIPDFIDKEPAAPSAPNFLERPSDGAFSSNACRDPWRLGMAVYHIDSKECRKALKTMVSWVGKTYDNNLSKMDNGFELDGTPLRKVDDWGTWGAYSAPMMVAASTNKTFQEMVNSGWEHNEKFYAQAGYYGNSLRLLSLLAVSGNWWKP